MNPTVILVDDHQLFSDSLKGLINSRTSFQCENTYPNGQLFIDAVKRGVQADLVLLDVKMPTLNGVETMEKLREINPAQKVLALSMEDDEQTIIQMLRNGARGYLLKDVNPAELELAMHDVVHNGRYITPEVQRILKTEGDKPEIGGRLLEFLKLSCSDLSYADIASQMSITVKTLDKYRDQCFKHYEVRSRTGLVLHAIKDRIYDVNTARL